MPPVATHLLLKLPREQVCAFAAPLVSFRPVEECAGKHQRLGVRQQMIPEQVVFKMAPEPAGLYRETLEGSSIQR